MLLCCRFLCNLPDDFAKILLVDVVDIEYAVEVVDFVLENYSREALHLLAVEAVLCVAIRYFYAFGTQ